MGVLFMRYVFLSIVISLATFFICSQSIAQVSDHKICKNYADSAVEQNKRNKKNDCGFGGAVWSDDWDHHYGWCFHHANKMALREGYDNRNEQLGACAKL